MVLGTLDINAQEQPSAAPVDDIKRNSTLRELMESDDDDEEEYSDDEEEEQQEQDKKALSTVMSSDDEEEDSDALKTAAPRNKPPLPTTQRNRRMSQVAPKQQQARRRRRRRSSAHFLRLTGRFDDDDEDAAEEEEAEPQQEQLGEMYKRAIRMNAENRINAGNSWGLRLIENIDKFLVDDEAEEEPVRAVPRRSSSSQPPPQQERSKAAKEKRVNFTKASCTLDASVKIYSYRVDDVHLTSYKVLANLNRTDNGKKKSRDDNEDTEVVNDEGESTKRTENASSERRAATETLESNIANLNMSKLDSAYDIDPLFHKMSKTFDEGGAKGLLLVNLGVGNQGCNIVFDSKEDAQDEKKEDDDIDMDQPVQEEGFIDITSLTSKLETLLDGASIDSFPLVPQLRSLREEYAQLEADGFVDHKISKNRSRRYASTEEEEKEAEMSIHHDAIERSRVSQATMTQGARDFDDDADDGGSYAAPDFGGGDDDDEDDFAFADFVAADENGARYSSISFENENFVDDTPPGGMATRSATAVVLDALCAGETLHGNEYEFFSSEALEKLTSGNDWAGASHWKKGDKLQRNKNGATKRKTKAKKKKAPAKNQVFVNLSAAPDLKDVLREPPKKKRGTDPLQLSKAMMTKYDKNDNLLPPDAGIGIEALSTLFLRPNAVMRGKENPSGGKTVGFHTTVEAFGSAFDDGMDDSYGDDNDGGGFNFASSGDNDDFMIGELEGVRKVEKIHVGYATVAKKVDVKRLKKDLWTELENTFVAERTEQVEEDEEKADDGEEQVEINSITSAPVPPKSLSFQEAVKDMEASKAQADVTLPFYFICLLHLANEKGLRLESTGLEDLLISQDDGAAPSFGTLPSESATGESTTSIAAQRKGRAKEMATYNDMDSDDEDLDE